MPLTGTVDYGLFDPSFPSGSFSLIGGDAKHFVTHAVSQGVTGSLYAVGCAEENAVIDARSFAEITAYLSFRGIDPTGFVPACFVPCNGTQKWWSLLNTEGTTPIEMAGVRFAINSSGNVQPDGVLHLKAPVFPNAHKGVPTANCWGAGTIGQYVHAVCSTGFGNPSFTFGSARIRLPIEGDLIDTNTGSSLDHGAEVLSVFGEDHPFAWGSLGGTTTDERGGYFDKVAIIDDPTSGGSGIGLLRWIGQPDTPAAWYRTPAGAIVDVTDQFPQVVADSGLNYAGVPGTEYDDVTAPSVCPNGEIVFGHTFSDNPQIVRAYRYRHNGGASFTFIDQFDFQQTAETIVDVNLKSAQFFREPGSSELLCALADDSKKIYFGSVEAAPLLDCPSSGFDLQYPPCVTAWTQCVKIQRRDGVSFRFTSLDQDIDFRGETYVTCGGLDPSATQTTAQTGEVGSSELAGLMVATGVKETELYGGLFDDAFVEIWLVPFDEPGNASSGDGGMPRRLAAGWAGKVSHSTRGYKMEVLGPGARLDQRPIVQVYSPQCRWVFGDERCGIDIDALAITGSVTSGINRGLFLATLGPEASSGTGAAASSGELTAQFSNGRVRWLTGVNAGQTTEVKSVDFDTGQIILWALTCFVPEVGDTFDLLPGCAQDFPTCRDLYDNAINFGGFPYVPGRDAIMESPSAKVG